MKARGCYGKTRQWISLTDLRDPDHCWDGRKWGQSAMSANKPDEMMLWTMPIRSHPSKLSVDAVITAMAKRCAAEPGPSKTGEGFGVASMRNQGPNGSGLPHGLPVDMFGDVPMPFHVPDVSELSAPTESCKSLHILAKDPIYGILSMSIEARKLGFPTPTTGTAPTAK